MVSMAKLCPFRFSVVIPTFNRLESTEKAILSVLDQTFPAEEVIVIDDGSTDNTSKILSAKYPNLNWIFQENHGVSHARNKGVENASGNWIAFLDSDDTWAPNKLKEQVDFLRTRSELALCHTDENWIRNQNPVKPPTYLDKSDVDIFCKSLIRCIICPSSVVMQKSVFIELGKFREDLAVCEDYDLWLRTIIGHKIGYLAEKLVTKYGGHQDQLSNRYWGMDRFRVQSLEALLKNPALKDDKRVKTIETIIEKLSLLAQGFAKHNKTDESNGFLENKEVYKKLLEDTIAQPLPLA